MDSQPQPEEKVGQAFGDVQTEAQIHGSEVAQGEVSSTPSSPIAVAQKPQEEAVPSQGQTQPQEALSTGDHQVQDQSQQSQQQQHLQHHNDDHEFPPMVLDVDSRAGDQDSALGLSMASSTSSMRASLAESVEENGRTYHRYKEGKYLLPNDDMEQNRLDLQHFLWKLTLDGKLALAPIDKPKRVLDFGTGTGIWAIEYALENLDAQVIGSDLSPIQPENVPENCTFEVDDASDEWTYSLPFDYIHGRAMFSCFVSPIAVFRSAFAALVPGGYLEMQEIFFKPNSIDDTIHGTALQKWNDKVVEGARMLGGKDWWCTPNYKRWFEEAGFVDVVERKFMWPHNTWPKGRKQKEMGLAMLRNSMEGTAAVSMAVLSRAFGWSAQEVEAYCENVMKDMKNRNIHAYWPIYVVYGRKPLTTETAAATAAAAATTVTTNTTPAIDNNMTSTTTNDNTTVTASSTVKHHSTTAIVNDTATTSTTDQDDITKDDSTTTVPPKTDTATSTTASTTTGTTTS